MIAIDLWNSGREEPDQTEEYVAKFDTVGIRVFITRLPVHSYSPKE